METRLNELRTLVAEDLQVVSYKWAARHFQLSANEAKQLLFAFVEKWGKSLSTTYLITGRTKGGEGRHIVHLVEAEELPRAKEALEQVTSLHVYSIRASRGKDDLASWNADNLQSTELFTKLLGQDKSALKSLNISMVDCALAQSSIPQQLLQPSNVAQGTSAGKETDEVMEDAEPPVPANGKAPTPKSAQKKKASAAAGQGLLRLTRDQGTKAAQPSAKPEAERRQAQEQPEPPAAGSGRGLEPISQADAAKAQLLAGKRVKLVKTTINEKGEEVTVVDDAAGRPADQADEPPAAAAPPPAKLKAPEQAAKPQKAAEAAKPAAGGGAGSGGAKRAAAKGKPANQRNIKSFFKTAAPKN